MNRTKISSSKNSSKSSSSRNSSTKNSIISLSRQSRNRFSRTGLRVITNDVQKNNNSIAYYDTKASSPGNHVVYSVNLTSGFVNRYVYSEFKNGEVSNLVRSYGVNPRRLSDREYIPARTENALSSVLMRSVENYRSRR